MTAKYPTNRADGLKRPGKVYYSKTLNQLKILSYHFLNNFPNTTKMYLKFYKYIYIGEF